MVTIEGCTGHAQIQELICDYGNRILLTDNKIDNDQQPIYDDKPPFVVSKYSKSFFEEAIPNLAKLHFLAEGRRLLVPFCSWTVHNLYHCQEKYQGWYKIEFLNEYKTIDGAHKVWSETIDIKNLDHVTSPSPKNNLKYQKDHMVEKIGGLLKQKIYNTMTTSKDLLVKTKQEYTENWLSIPEDEFNKLCWIKFTNCQNDANPKKYLASGCLMLMT